MAVRTWSGHCRHCGSRSASRMEFTCRVLGKHSFDGRSRHPPVGILHSVDKAEMLGGACCHIDYRDHNLSQYGERICEFISSEYIEGILLH